MVRTVAWDGGEAAVQLPSVHDVTWDLHQQLSSQIMKVFYATFYIKAGNNLLAVVT